MKHLLPTDTQTLLLKACLTNSPEAMDHFEKWVLDVDIDFNEASAHGLGLPQVYDKLDFGSQRLLSLLYYNLNEQGFDSQVTTSLKGYYKYIWLRNQLIQKELDQLSEAFQSGGVEFIAFKGSSLFKNYYPHFGTRPTVDLDIVIQLAQLEVIDDILTKLGWETKLKYQRILGLKHFLVHAITLKKGNIELDLHSKFSKYFMSPKTVNEFWKLSSTDSVGKKYLKPAHELCCTILHGMYWDIVTPEIRTTS